MTCFEIIIAIVNIIAVIAAPIIAVKVGQYLQERAQSRKDKMDIFKTLMINRYGWSVETVQAMNIIEIVFSDDNNVLKAWKEFYDKSCVEAPDEMQLKKMQTAKDKLLETIAQSLGYKQKVTWETIQNPYIPKGMIDAMQQQQMIQSGQVEWAKAAGMFAQMMNANSAFQQSKQQGGKPGASACKN